MLNMTVRPSNDAEQLLWNAADVAIALGIGQSTVYRWLDQGKLPKPIKVGGSLTRWRKSDIELFICCDCSMRKFKVRKLKS